MARGGIGFAILLAVCTACWVWPRFLEAADNFGRNAPYRNEVAAADNLKFPAHVEGVTR